MGRKAFGNGGTGKACTDDEVVVHEVLSGAE
jgi:hypothetical protein